MSGYAEYFNNGYSDKSLMKKAFYALVKLKLSEDQAWYALTNSITGMDYSSYCKTKKIKSILDKLKVDYQIKKESDEAKERDRLKKFKESLKPETIDYVKKLWKELDKK